jgi:group I intron endonuclease
MSNTYGYIYKTTNLVNGKSHIGQHKSVDWDYNYIGSGVLLKRAIKKYGIENFSCFPLMWAWNKDELNKLEIEYIAHYRPEYNIAKGGEGFTGSHSDKTRMKMSETRKNMSDETKKKMSEARKGIKLSDETKKKMSETHKNMSDETRKKMSEYHKLLRGEKAPYFGFSHSEESKKKMSEYKKQYWKLKNKLDRKA